MTIRPTLEPIVITGRRRRRAEARRQLLCCVAAPAKMIDVRPRITRLMDGPDDVSVLANTIDKQLLWCGRAWEACLVIGVEPTAGSHRYSAVD